MLFFIFSSLYKLIFDLSVFEDFCEFFNIFIYDSKANKNMNPSKKTESCSTVACFRELIKKRLMDLGSFNFGLGEKH